MELKKLLEVINKKRNKLHLIIDEKGLDDRETLEYSQELDKLITLYTKKSNGKLHAE